MKRTILILSFLFSLLSIYSQVISNDTHVEIAKPAGLDKIFIFAGINSSTEIKYSGAAVNVKWFKFADGIRTEISNVPYISPENNTGYICSADGTEISFWVFDYTLYYVSTASNLTIVDGDFPCEEVKLNINPAIPEFNYQNPTGRKLTLDRTFNVKYNSLEWKENEWTSSPQTEIVSFPAFETKISVPLTDTPFILSGDEFASALGLQPVQISSQVYTTKAVKCHLTTITTKRDALNENDRPVSETQLDGSAPLDVQFLSNPTSNVKNYLWKIFKNGTLLLTRTVKDHIFTFNESGNYKVTLEVSNQFCSDSASVNFVISESQIMAPSIFTPNGDDVNDEFRVAYRSIIQFQGTIINRWGRTLFSWTDPAKGWDGTINGKPAAEGTYFYIITAKGSDEKTYKLKGHINLLR